MCHINYSTSNEIIRNDQTEKATILRFLKYFRTISAIGRVLRTRDANTECCICWDQYEDDQEQLSLISICGHCFHQDCIKAWFGENPSCPTCRTHANVGNLQMLTFLELKTLLSKQDNESQVQNPEQLTDNSQIQDLQSPTQSVQSVWI